MPTQDERRAATAQRILDAAAAVLVERGAAGFTTGEVAKRAGCSQGAVFKYHPTKADLLAALVGDLFAGLVTRYEAEFSARAEQAALAATDPIARLGLGLDLLWDVFQDERLIAAYDLFAAARTDSDLQADLEPVVRAHEANLHALADLLFPDAMVEDRERLHDAVDLVSATMQGLVINRIAVPDPVAEERVRHLLHALVGDRLLAGGSR